MYMVCQLPVAQPEPGPLMPSPSCLFRVVAGVLAIVFALLASLRIITSTVQPHPISGGDRKEAGAGDGANDGAGGGGAGDEGAAAAAAAEFDVSKSSPMIEMVQTGIQRSQNRQ